MQQITARTKISLDMTTHTDLPWDLSIKPSHKVIIVEIIPLHKWYLNFSLKLHQWRLSNNLEAIAEGYLRVWTDAILVEIIPVHEWYLNFSPK